MGTTEAVKQKIRRELKGHQEPSLSSLVPPIASGHVDEAVSELLFFASPGVFFPLANAIMEELRCTFPTADPLLQERMLEFLANFSIAMLSFLPRWNLSDRSRHDRALTNAQALLVARSSKELATELVASAPGVAGILAAKWRREVLARLRSEGVSNPDKMASEVVGRSIGSYVENLSFAVGTSNLRRIAEMRASGRTVTEISNDYAAFLDYTLYLGASFVTCNPPLIDAAWTSNPQYWDGVVDTVISALPGENPDLLARSVTLEIVYSNMRLLRPIFLVSDGEMGYVSLQVNPKRHDDCEAMIRDATAIYQELGGKLEGGVPNVVFKLPATKAGLEAARELTSQGIGVNITVSFGLFQQLPFARVLNEGKAIFSTITHMTGRLAFAVRDELLAKIATLESHGVTERMAREAAAWSGIAVLKKLHRALEQARIDMSRVRPLVASLRVYDGDPFLGLPSPVPDITEALGTRIITVFPNVRHAFDKALLEALDPCRIEVPVPAKALDILTFSEIFKQAYFVEDDLTTRGDDQRFRPSQALSLGDEAGVTGWVPVHHTLQEFCQSYDRFVQRILERKASRQPLNAGMATSST